MKAAIVEQFGDPDHLLISEAPDPTRVRIVCLIAIDAIDTLFLDTMLRSGNAPEGMRPELPWIPATASPGASSLSATESSRAGSVKRLVRTRQSRRLRRAGRRTR